ncbi:MAG: 50S ribosomal protein L2 [Planctomycetota bacterium]
MGVRNYKPTSNGRRTGQVSDWAELTNRTKNAPTRSLIEKLNKTGGRNNHGQVTARHMGGGHVKLWRNVDFKRRHDDIPAKVIQIEYDPNRTARIALIAYADGLKSYILAPKDLKAGDEVLSGEKQEIKPGNCMPLRAIPTGIPLNCVELQPKRGGQLGRSAGVSVQLLAKEDEYGTITLPSGEVRKVHLDCRATIGDLGNIEHNTITVGKAGRHRHMGYRPYSRGSARNPVDHPMGGGEGRRAGGRHPIGPGGVLSKGGKTRKPKARSNEFIIRGRKKKRAK